ncbi:MAG: aminopeptidase P family protein [Prevotella sp.]|nr:aminopeptidase P family protein [Prevotella sp.]
MTIKERLTALRELMKENQLQAFIFPSTDPHNGEYVPDHWKGREWISGFNGSAGTAVVTLDAAALWTDSRYFIAAAQQLEGTGFELMKERIPGTPTIDEWLADQLRGKGSCDIGIDGMASSASYVSAMQSALTTHGDYTLFTEMDPLDLIWTDRPALPDHPVEIYPMEFAGESATDKLARIRATMAARHADAMLVTMLDDIAWTLNLRGSDMHCNPVFVSYLLITKDDAVLFVNPEKVTTGVADYLREIHVSVDNYDMVCYALTQLRDGTIWLDPNRVNDTLFHAPECQVLSETSPIPAMKAIKNETEMDGFRHAMLRDGIAMVKFLSWLKPAVEKGGETELTIDRKLTSLRAEQPLFRGISFDTIAGYGYHGAIVHYEATEETDIPLKPEGFLLLDSGAQYLDGTTDITRTIALGPLTEKEKRVYTLVLKGHIQLQMLKFPKGACGSQLDAIARHDLWADGLNFLHGTGHGVGTYLNVHEGPHQIRMEWWPAPLLPGMTVTDEPGIYMEGEFGVRVENTLLITPYMQTQFGEFLQFETLTLCPIDTTPVICSMLSDEEKAWLNDYHQSVYDKISPFLSDEERDWLRTATKKIC